MTTLVEPTTTPAAAPWSVPTSAKPPVTDADIIDAAADYIDEHGWTQGTARNGYGHVCAVGAIYAVAVGFKVPPTDDAWTSDTLGWNLVNALVCRMTEAAPVPSGSVTAFNDDGFTTRDNVISYLRAAAKTLRS